MTNNNENKAYYLGTYLGNGDKLVYESDLYSFTELDVLNMIKILLVEGRNRSLGRKFLEVYRDSTESRKDLSNTRLKLIGINENGDRKPTITKDAKSR
jgi:hypothetical protein